MLWVGGMGGLLHVFPFLCSAKPGPGPLGSTRHVGIQSLARGEMPWLGSAAQRCTVPCNVGTVPSVGRLADASPGASRWCALPLGAVGK